MLVLKTCASIAWLNFYFLRKGFWLAVPKDTVGLDRESVVEELEEVVRSLPQSGRKGWQMLTSAVFFFIWSRSPVHGTVTSTFRVSLPTSMNLSFIIPHMNVQTLVHSVVTDSSNRQSILTITSRHLVTQTLILGYNFHPHRFVTIS